MKHQYTVILTPIEDGWYMATVPELPGAITQGQTIEEARENIRDAIELLLQTYREDALREASADAVCETIELDVPAA